MSTVSFVRRAFLTLCLTSATSGVYALDGIYDTTFSGDGFSTIPIDNISAGFDLGTDVLVDAAGSSYLIGQAAGSNGFRQIAIVKLKIDGTRDTSFGQNGIAVTTFVGVNRYANRATFDSTGLIVVANRQIQGANEGMSMCRFSPVNGATAPWGGFACVTKQVDFVDAGTDRVNDVALAPDGKLYLIGSAENASGNFGAIVRFLANGDPDLAFNGGSANQLLLNLGADTQLNAGVVRADGRLLVCGARRSAIGDDQDILVARFNGNGFDSSFSGDGFASFAINAGASVPVQDDVCRDIAIGKDNTAVFVGTAEASISKKQGIIGFLTANGSAQQAFSRITTGVDIDINSVVVTSDNKAMVSGTIDYSSSTDKRGYVTRYLNNGTVDNAFVNGDWKEINLNPGAAADDGELLNRIVLAAGKPMVVGGRQITGGDWDFTVARLVSDLIYADGF